MMKTPMTSMVNQAIVVAKKLAQLETVVAIIIAVTVVAVTMSTADVILQNYRLERDVRVMEQKVRVAQIKLDSKKLENQYYATDSYLDIASRKLLGKGAPGEQLIIVPLSVARKELPAQTTTQSTEDRVGTLDNRGNMQRWFDFLSGRY